MFNSPRPAARSNLSTSAFLSSPNDTTAPYTDPLASSMPLPPPTYGAGDVDPWSTVPSPARSGTPRTESVDVRPERSSREETMGVTAREGISGFMNDPPALYLSLLDQLEPTSMAEVPLPAVHRLLSTSKLPATTIEKILTLTSPSSSALTRQEFFITLSLVALAQSQPSLPSEDLSVEQLSASISSLPLPSLSVPPAPASSTLAKPPTYTSTPSYGPSSSPWDTAPRTNGHARNESAGATALEAGPERGWWKNLEKVEVDLVAEKEGWFLQKYRVTSDKRNAEPVSRRYSDFVWLFDTLVKRYPFRLLPALPPKRIGPDATFLEQRRRALQRFLTSIVTHPVLTTDGALNVFLTEPSFESWRKRTKVSTDEESSSKRLNPAQEMSIPADLDDKLHLLRDRLPGLLGSHQKLVVFAERGVERAKASSADAGRVGVGLRSLEEEMPKGCWRCVGQGQEGESCALCRGVSKGLGEVAEGWTRVAEEGERRVQALLQTHVEALKTQRDLYVSFRDLFVRHDRLSKDTVEALRKKVEGRQKKAEGLRSAGKVGWEGEVEKLVAANDSDTSQISTLLARRVFIRACMWHELAVVFHARQAAQATMGWKSFVRTQEGGCEVVGGVWREVGERIEGMPVD